MSLPKAGERLMEFYVPIFKLKEFSEMLAGEGVPFEITDKIYSIVVEGEERYEVTKVKVNLAEIELPAIYDEDSLKQRRAFRLPSGKKILFTDVNGNFERFLEPPPGWER